jgi:DNA-binding FrmR family transcriptional regulator
MDISGILTQIKTGGFQNPVSTGVSSRLADLTANIPSLSQLTDMANSQAILHSTTPPTTLQLETALNSINTAVANTNNLLGHTDRVAGVNLSGNGTLATIAKTMQSAKSINGETSCSTVLSAFGSIQKAAELVTDTINSINLIESFLLDIKGAILDIPNQLEAYSNKIVQQIASDVAALAQAQLDVLQSAVASSLVSLFQDECISQVLAGVMTQPLKNEVTAVADQIAYKKQISFTGH